MGIEHLYNRYMDKESTSKPLLNQIGQTSVEYILLIVVIVVVASSVFEKLEGFLISNPDSLKNKYLGGYSSMFSGSNGSFQGEYKYFSIRK
tara:strand:- start:77357 stop:77629 length:273 start_codon:yes stop_codon:yes gene_type:complete